MYFKPRLKSLWIAALVIVGALCGQARLAAAAEMPELPHAGTTGPGDPATSLGLDGSPAPPPGLQFQIDTTPLSGFPASGSAPFGEATMSQWSEFQPQPLPVQEGAVLYQQVALPATAAAATASAPLAPGTPREVDSPAALWLTLGSMAAVLLLVVGTLGFRAFQASQAARLAQYQARAAMPRTRAPGE
ncbi:MAG: hypothetical protein K8T25_03955 [Planctomycetia bacterium]|nr:hypothetical protein [Planctomycetia bacterium]